MKLFEAFTGIGAWHKAFSRLNIPIDLIGFSEINQNAIDSYSLIHNINENINIGDISNLHKINDDIDILCYSPPCQSYSMAGSKKGLNDERGQLIYDVFELIDIHRPKYCLMENVKGLTTKKFINEFNFILDTLNILGYNSYVKILNAKDYGIPQNRERVFIVSIKKDIDKCNYQFPKPIPLKKSLSDILEQDAELPILHNIYGGFKETTPRLFYDYSPTIRTSSGGGHIPSVVTSNISKIEKTIDSYDIRKLSTLECMRLMDFDDADLMKIKSLNISNTQTYKLIGNSIVVNVIEEILKSLFGGKNNECKT